MASRIDQFGSKKPAQLRNMEDNSKCHDFENPSDLRIHRLRVTHLCEHDCTLLMAVKWRQQIRNCDEKRILNDGNHGGMPGRDSMTPAVLETPQCEMSRASKRPLTHKDHNATACCDQITVNLGGLTARGHGQKLRHSAHQWEDVRGCKTFAKDTNERGGKVSQAL